MNTPRGHLTAFLIQILCLISIVSLAHGSEIPNDARQLLEKREEAVKAIDRRLVEELEKLKVAYTKHGELDSANAIVEIVNKYRIEPIGQKSASDQIARLTGVWKRDYDSSLFEFDAEGGGIWGGRDKFRVTYDPKMNRFELKRPQWDINTIVFSATGDTLIGTIVGGRSYILTRIK